MRDLKDRIILKCIIYLVGKLSPQTIEEFRDFLLASMGFMVYSGDDLEELLNEIQGETNGSKTDYH